MQLIKILNSLTRILTLTLVLIMVMIVFLAANYEPEPTGDLADQPEELTEVAVNRFTDDPGFQLFDEWDCDNCHEVNRKKIGPALAGVTQRRERDWIYRFVQNSSKLIAEGDPTAVALYNEFNQLSMQPHELSKEEIDLILAYIEKAAD